MTVHFGRFLWRMIRAAGAFALGVVAMLVVVGVVYLDNRADLSVWHLADLDEEFRASSKIDTFEQYLLLEERLFRQLDTLVHDRIEPRDRDQINRFNRGSLSNPAGWSPNWNRSFVLPASTPRAGVLLLHGMSDSPYSLRHLGTRLNAGGAAVLGLRIPGHGTAPSGLVEVSWQDMAAAVRLAMRHLATIANGQPLYIVGYSNGAALAVQYVLSTLDDETLPKAARLVVLSPEIGITPVAALSVWQARLGHLLGLEKLLWNSILPEYDPFKYGSFAVNAGDVAYRLTTEIQERISVLTAEGKMDRFPPILAFSSVVDATVSTRALIEGLFERLPPAGHELVLFDVNQNANLAPLLKWDPAELVTALQKITNRSFELSLVTNVNRQSRQVMVRRLQPEANATSAHPIGLAWPQDVYSLAHIALPFPVHDPLYGGEPRAAGPVLSLGNTALRGERGILRITASDMLRMRWNPFYPFVEKRVTGFLNLQ